MDRSKNISAWTEQGYILFAEEGLDGIHVERLARILQLNKSGFYHYFGDMEGYYAELLRLHRQKAGLYFDELSKINAIDPDWFRIVAQFKVPVIFHIQLRRCKTNSAFYATADELDRNGAERLTELWSDYLGYKDTPDLAMRYYSIVRDMIYSRTTSQNMSYEFLRNLVSEAKELARQISESHTTVADEFH